MWTFEIDYVVNGKKYGELVDAKDFDAARRKLALMHHVSEDEIKIKQTIIIGRC